MRQRPSSARPPWALLLPLALATACGGAQSPDEGTRDHNDPGEHAHGPPETSGGEAEAEEPGPTTNPVVLRTTIPVPVPQPAVARDDLSEPLQAVWTAVEEQVSNARPDPPEDMSVAGVQAWTDTDFVQWIGARREQITATRALAAAVPAEPVHERAVALALWAYAMEDFGAQIAGAPVPTPIAEDEDLRRIYIDSLNSASQPLAMTSIELYADCQQRLESLGDESPWLPWRAYCVQRGVDVIEGYGLTPPEVEAEAAE